MRAIEVRVRDMRPGDRLCTQQDRPEVSGLSMWNAYRLWSRALHTAWEGLTDLSQFWDNREHFHTQAEAIEHVSYGPFRARVVFPSGAVVVYRRNAPVAVYRKGVEQ
jgi:hypothetical protein